MILRSNFFKKQINVKYFLERKIVILRKFTGIASLRVEREVNIGKIVTVLGAIKHTDKIHI